MIYKIYKSSIVKNKEFFAMYITGDKTKSRAVKQISKSAKPKEENSDIRYYDDEYDYEVYLIYDSENPEDYDVLELLRTISKYIKDVRLDDYNEKENFAMDFIDWMADGLDFEILELKLESFLKEVLK